MNEIPTTQQMLEAQARAERCYAHIREVLAAERCQIHVEVAHNQTQGTIYKWGIVPLDTPQDGET